MYNPKFPKSSYPSGREVYHWPEFQAFAKRLGIDWNLPTVDLCIFIPLDGNVKVVHEYLGDEMFNMRKDREQKSA